jgi:hypothetical protein
LARVMTITVRDHFFGYIVLIKVVTKLNS